VGVGVGVAVGVGIGVGVGVGLASSGITDSARPKSIRSDYLLALAEVFKKDLKQIAEFDGP